MPKYKAIKTTIDGHSFDSLAESRFYLWLKAQGVEFTMQVEYELLPQLKTGKRYGTFERVCYVADFVSGGAVIDVKGVETPVFSLKRRLFVDAYPNLTIYLVKMKGQKIEVYRGKATKQCKVDTMEFVNILRNQF